MSDIRIILLIKSLIEISNKLNKDFNNQNVAKLVDQIGNFGSTGLSDASFCLITIDTKGPVALTLSLVGIGLGICCGTILGFSSIMQQRKLQKSIEQAKKIIDDFFKEHKIQNHMPKLSNSKSKLDFANNMRIVSQEPISKVAKIVKGQEILQILFFCI